MAESFIEEIYFYANTISQLRHVVHFIRIMDDRQALTLLKNNLTNMEKMLDACITDGYEEAETLNTCLMDMADLKDIILLGDMLENIAIPIMERWMQTWVGINEQVDERYAIESTASGFLTLKDTVANRYLHSNNDPMEEARKIIEHQYNYEKKSYFVWGCGLGYQAYQIYLYSEGTIPIKIYEPNLDIIEYAFRYGVLAWIPQEILQIIPRGTVSAFLMERQDSDAVFYLLPYINCEPDMEQKRLLTEDYIRQSSKWETTHELKINFNRNKDCLFLDIHELDRSGLKTDMVIIAGGPSVDHVIKELGNWQGTKTLIAVGTIWKRLLSEGIKPDFVVFMDPYDTVYGQVKDVEDTTPTFLLSMSTYWKVARTYKGKIFTVCVDGPEYGIREYASQNGLELWPSGGTVTALAMEFAIRFGAKKIYLAGVDLAFPGGMSHAAGTNFRSRIELTQLMEIPGTMGNVVYTNETFQLYRQWIENRISQNPHIEFVNMSDIGAQICGTTIYRKNS